MTPLDDSTNFNGGAPPAPDRSLEQIREILLGEHVRQSSERFSHLTLALATATESLRSDMAQRFAALEAQLRSEVDELRARLVVVKDDLAGRVTDVSVNLAQSEQRLRARIEELELDLRAMNGKLDDRLDLELSVLRRELGEQAEAQRMALESWAQRLSFEKMDKVGLATLFTELAGRLQPGAGEERPR